MVLSNNPDYFLTIAREHSISRAAEKLFVSQSYLSQYLSKLEQELEVKLFDRSKIPLEITDAGRAYLLFLERYQNIHQQLRLDLEELDSQRAQTLRLGIGTLRGATLLPDILPTYMGRHPNIRLLVSELPVSELYHAVEYHDVDFALMNTIPPIPPNFLIKTLLYERIFLVFNQQHPLAPLILEAKENNKPLPWDLLHQELFVLLASTLPLAQAVNNYLSQNGIVLPNTLVTNSIYTALNMAQRNLSFCFLGETVSTSATSLDRLMLVDLNTSDLVFPVSVIYRENAVLSLAAQDFIQITKEHYENMVQQPREYL